MTRMDRIGNEYIRESLTLAPVTEEGYPSRGRPKNRLMDCVKDDMRIKGMSVEMTSDGRANPT
jgi:hypothetical protein